MSNIDVPYPNHGVLNKQVGCLLRDPEGASAIVKGLLENQAGVLAD